MKSKEIDNTKVGLMVLAGLVFLIFTLYMIGKNRNLLGSTFTIRAVVTNVNGLVPGNNVRFKGIDVGTVKSIAVENDTAIYVTMIIDEKMRPHIKKNAIVSIGTDGLMGNKLININSTPGPSHPISPDDVLASRRPVETDEMLRTLNTTNNNIERITQNLYEITVKLNSSQSLWTLLSDTVLAVDLKGAIVDFRKAGANTSDMTAHGRDLLTRIEQGDGLVNRLFTDSMLTYKLESSVAQIESASSQTATMMKDLKTVVDEMRRGEGTAGLLFKDTLMRASLFKSALSIEQGTDRFNQNMEALKSNFLFRGYFRRQEKAQKKETSQSKADSN
jgi:phospholipid/cholesterol/gamma-HCH transport system substrate-binding protein